MQKFLKPTWLSTYLFIWNVDNKTIIFDEWWLDEQPDHRIADNVHVSDIKIRNILIVHQSDIKRIFDGILVECFHLSFVHSKW